MDGLTGPDRLCRGTGLLRPTGASLFFWALRWRRRASWQWTRGSCPCCAPCSSPSCARPTARPPVRLSPRLSPLCSLTNPRLPRALSRHCRPRLASPSPRSTTPPAAPPRAQTRTRTKSWGCCGRCRPSFNSPPLRQRRRTKPPPKFSRLRLAPQSTTCPCPCPAVQVHEAVDAYFAPSIQAQLPPSSPFPSSPLRRDCGRPFLWRHDGITSLLHL